VILSADLAVMEVSDSWLRLIGKGREAILARGVLEILPVETPPKELHPPLQTALRGCLEQSNFSPSVSKEVQLGGWLLKVKPVPSVGQDKPCICVHLQAASAEGRGDFGAAHPQLTQERDEAREALQALRQEYESFAHSVSHDLRAPLRGIDMYAAVVAEDYRDRIDDEGKRLLELVRTLARKLNGYIDDLLAFSRLGRQRVAPSRVDMSALACSVFEGLKAKVPERKIRFEVETLPPAFADLAMMKQLFIQLLSNAVKFTGPREDALITVTGQNSSEYNTYCVRDNGVGFDPEFSSKLFGMFQRLHSKARAPAWH
jgi:light-regulated signal transduction histidine kinase (bacteriophytochrome)